MHLEVFPLELEMKFCLSTRCNWSSGIGSLYLLSGSYYFQSISKNWIIFYLIRIVTNTESTPSQSPDVVDFHIFNNKNVKYWAICNHFVVYGQLASFIDMGGHQRLFGHIYSKGCIIDILLCFIYELRWRRQLVSLQFKYFQITIIINHSLTNELFYRVVFIFFNLSVSLSTL